jgi:hypothetical protein
MGADFSMSGAEEMQISVDFDQYSFESPEADVLDSSYRFFDQYSYECPEADVVDRYNRFLEHANFPPQK